MPPHSVMSDFAKKHYGWDTTADATSESSSSPTSMPEGFEAVIRRIAKYPQDMVLNEAQRGNLSFAITNTKGQQNRSKTMELVPILSEYLGNSTHAKLAIITPYLKQQHYYNLALEGLRKEGTSADALPKVYTVEEAEGLHWDIGIVDYVNTDADDLDLLKCEKRSQTMHTRATQFMFIIGPDFSSRRGA